MTSEYRYYQIWDHRGRDRVGLEFTTLSVQSVPITNEFLSSNPVVLDTTLCDKVCSDLRHVLRFPPPIKLTATI